MSTGYRHAMFAAVFKEGWRSRFLKFEDTVNLSNFFGIKVAGIQTLKSFNLFSLHETETASPK